MPRFRIDPGEDSLFETPQSVSGSAARIPMNHAVTGSGSESQSRGAPRRRSRLGEWIAPAIALGLFSLLGVAIYLASQPYFGWDLAISQAVQGISWFGLESL